MSSFVSTAKTPPLHENEPIIWQFLIANGFTRNQAAGIMGNLRQEHGFQTSDAGAAGLGIAQWTGGRRFALQSRPDYLTLSTQLNFLLDELNTTESVAGQAIRSAQTVEDAVIAFESKFERCNPVYCMTSKRVAYAHEIIARY